MYSYAVFHVNGNPNWPPKEAEKDLLPQVTNSGIQIVGETAKRHDLLFVRTGLGSRKKNLDRAEPGCNGAKPEPTLISKFDSVYVHGCIFSPEEAAAMPQRRFFCNSAPAQLHSSKPSGGPVNHALTQSKICSLDRTRRPSRLAGKRMRRRNYAKCSFPEVHELQRDRKGDAKVRLLQWNRQLGHRSGQGDTVLNVQWDRDFLGHVPDLHGDWPKGVAGRAKFNRYLPSFFSSLYFATRRSSSAF